MQVQVNTGNGLENKESLERWADSYLNEQLDRFNRDITRVEVQLSDENGARKGASDLRCTLEARLTHHQPVAATGHGESQDQAFRAATAKLIHLLDHTIGKTSNHRARDTIRKNVDAQALAGDTPLSGV